VRPSVALNSKYAFPYESSSVPHPSGQMLTLADSKSAPP
jgi:hypothetical protein